jgi:two-component system CheB/CheR fusion protein
VKRRSANAKAKPKNRSSETTRQSTHSPRRFAAPKSDADRSQTEAGLPRRSQTKAGQQSNNPSLAPFPIVGVGASAGGLEAFTEFLKNLPLDTGMGFVLIQHLDPAHTSALTQLLSKTTSLPVQEVTNGLPVEPNHVYVIAPNTNLAIAQGVLKCQPRGTGRGVYRSIDFFFESLAQDQHDCAIGVILSGTASDGTLGLEAIKAEGGITFAQNESAKYDSMPRSAVAAGCVDFVLSPEQIAQELARIAKHPFVAGNRRLALIPVLSHPMGEERNASQWSARSWRIEISEGARSFSLSWGRWPACRRR